MRDRVVTISISRRFVDRTFGNRRYGYLGSGDRGALLVRNGAKNASVDSLCGRFRRCHTRDERKN